MTQASPAAPLSASLHVRLSLMMFLQYAIWGAWLPLLWPFLHDHRGFGPSQIGNMFAVGAVGAIVAPFVAGQIADRLFATERFLGISHVVGGVLVWQLADLEGYGAFLAFSLLYSLVYSPTLPLTNSLAFHHLPDRDRDFGKVRVWGTVGWICAGIGIGQWLLSRHTPSGPGVTAEAIQAAQWAGMADAFRLSGALGVAMGVFCLFLPHTPPAKGAKQNATFEALGEVKHNPLLLLFLIAVPISCIHQFYFVHTAGFLGAYQARVAEAAAAAGQEGSFVAQFNALVERVFGVGGGGLMTVGQMSEILVLSLIPVFAKSVSRKTFLLIGTCAYAARMALFAYYESIPLPPTLTLILGVAMHGLCFGCWIFVAFMIVDEETSADVRASAQSLFNLVIIGIGVIVGSKLADRAATAATDSATGLLDYTRLFSYPLWGALGCLVVLLLFYPSRSPRAAA